VVVQWPETSEVPPKCPHCGGRLRPDVVWFEEPMPEEETTLAFRFSANCDVFLAIGTSAVVYPAAALPVEALESGATVVEINPQPTPLTPRADFVLASAAGKILPDLLKSLK
jgi:NAD-dependent protein deacetylase/lipoamidase